MATPYELREQKISELSSGRGYAFLTQGQKDEVNALMDKPADISSVPLNKTEPTILSSASGQKTIGDQSVQFDQIKQGLESARMQAEQIKAGLQTAQPQTPSGTIQTPPDDTVTLMGPDGQSVTIGNAGANVQNIQDYINRGYEVAEGRLPTGVRVLGTNVDPVEQQSQDMSQYLDQDLDDINTQFDQIAAQVDAYTQTQITNIKNLYAERRRVMEDANKRAMASYKQFGVRAGTERYAGEIAQGILNEEERQGMGRINELVNEEAMLISQAEQARTQKQWEIFSQKFAAIQDARAQRADEFEKMQKAALDKNKTVLEEAKLQQEILKLQDDRQQSVIDDVVPYLDSILSGNPEQDELLIDMASKNYQLDPNFLRSSLKDYQQNLIKQAGANDWTQYVSTLEGGTPTQEGFAAFKRKLALAEDTSANTQVVEAGGRKLLIDSFTGRTIRDIGAAPVSGSGAEGIGIVEPPTPQLKPYTDAFNSAVLGLPAAQMKQATKVFSNYINKYIKSGDSEDLTNARNYIVRTAMVGAGVDQQNQAIGRSSAVASLTDIKALISEAANRGVATNLLTGNVEKLANQLAGTTKDPELAFIGSQIQQLLQVYRRSMTGVAFSPKESAEYARIFPDITNTAKLNSAKVDSLVSAFNRNNRSTLGFYIGDSNYDALFGQAQTPKLPGKGNNEALRSQLKTGEILIERNGQIGAIPEGEFNPQTDKKL